MAKPAPKQEPTQPKAGPKTKPAAAPTQYNSGPAYQYDKDNPVRPADKHADKNLNLRGYAPNPDSNFERELVDYGSGDPTQPPQFATLFDPPRVPALSNFYCVHNWNWGASPEPGTRGDPIKDWPATALGLQTTPGETLRVPVSGYDIGGGMEVIVIYADESTICLKYTREDSAGKGYTVHMEKIKPYPTAPACRYLSYLVRLWQDTPGASWRASAQHIATEEHRGFANLESLFAFLREQTEQTTQVEKGETYDHLWKEKP